MFRQSYWCSYKMWKKLWAESKLKFQPNDQYTHEIYMNMRKGKEENRTCQNPDGWLLDIVKFSNDFSVQQIETPFYMKLLRLLPKHNTCTNLSSLFCNICANNGLLLTFGWDSFCCCGFQSIYFSLFFGLILFFAINFHWISTYYSDNRPSAQTR